MPPPSPPLPPLPPTLRPAPANVSARRAAPLLLPRLLPSGTPAGAGAAASANLPLPGVLPCLLTLRCGPTAVVTLCAGGRAEEDCRAGPALLPVPLQLGPLRPLLAPCDVTVTSLIDHRRHLGRCRNS